MNLRSFFYGMLVTVSLTGCNGSSSARHDLSVYSDPGSSNSAPVASADRAALAAGASGKIAVLDNDSDPDSDPISIISVTTPGHGTATIDTNATPDVFHDDTILYTPAANYLGADTFSYTISDGGSGRASGAVSVTIGVNPVSLGAPTAQKDSATTATDTPVVIAVLENDFDSDGDALVITSISPPSNGTALIDDAGTPADRSDDRLIYQPATGFAGPDSFLYTITDGTTAVTSSVSIDVMPVTPAGTLEANVSGVVIKGPMMGAQIRLFSLGGDGHKGSAVPVAQTVTDAAGYWEAFVPLPRKNLLVVSSGGAYQDEAQQQDSLSKRYIRFDDSESLETVLPEAETHSVLSVYSNALLLRSRYTTTGNDFMSKHGQARTAATAAFGFDPLVADATDPSGPAVRSSAEARRHALVLGGAANAINRISTSLGKTDPDHEMVYALVRDLSDCKLDGNDLYGPITFTFGGVPVTMPTNINLNTEILRFRNNNFSNYSNTPLTTVDTTLCTPAPPPVDTTAPVITLLGSNPLPVARNAVFSDPGVTAVDNLDGDVTSSIVTSGTVNTSVPGTYVLTYSVNDAAGNTASVSRAVVVETGSSPVITLIGPSSIILEAGTAYIDAGVSAADPEDGDLSSSVITNNPVNSFVPGAYNVTYNVTDSDGLPATTISRSVVVVDTTAPALALLGAAVVNIQQNDTYTDAGATALDLVDGDLSAVIAIANPVDTSVTGSYMVAYQVTDVAGNVVTTSRTVNVILSGVPSITLAGASSTNVEAGSAYADAGATAVDPEDGDVTAAVVVVNLVDTSVPGTYVITYNVADSDGNSATEITRTVIVADTTAPLITLTGPASISQVSGTPYADMGATALDSFDGNLTSSIATTNPVDTNTPGSYTVRYNVSDASGNSALQVTRTVTITSNNIPVISLVGAASVTHEAATPYVDMGATAGDVEDGNLTSSIVTADSVDAGVPGSYSVTYDVSDSDANAALQVTRTVNVVDTTSPVITRVGPALVSVEAATPYTEPGFSASDTLDGNLTGSVFVTGSVDTNMPGDYVLNYDVTDAAGNSASSVTRTVQVRDTTVPVITLTGANPQIIEVGSAYTELGANATDNLDSAAAITAAIVIDATAVNTGAVGTYNVTYDVTDANGNAAATANRSVQVVDTTIPVITLTGANPQIMEAGSAYTELGANATDNLDSAAAITAAIVINATAVNTGALGTYNVTYDVTDANGNAAVTVNRSVEVVDTTAPIIIVLGNNPESVAEDSLYADASATASDSFDGDVTSDIVTVNNVNTSVPGSYTVTYDVIDAATNNAIQAVRNVTVTPVNDAPVLDFSVPDRSATETLVYSTDLSLYFSDEEGDALDFILTGLPAGTGLFIDTNTGVLSGTPNANDAAASPISLTIKAEDPSLDSAQDTFLLTIVQSVDLTLLTVVDDATPNEGQAIVYTISLSNAGPSGATNIDIEDLQPAGVTFGSVTPGTGTFAGNVWSVPSLASGDSTTLIINATVDAGTAGMTIANFAELIGVDQAEVDVAETSSANINVPTGASVLKTWLGGAGGPPGSETDWGRNGNWSPNGVPSANDEIVIENAAFYPVLDADFTASSLRVTSGSNFDIGPHTLTITGEVRGDSPITGTGLVVVSNGTVRGGLPSLRVDGYVDVQNNLTVNGDLTVLGTFDVDTWVVVNGNLNVTGGTGIMLMQVGGSFMVVNGDALFDGGDHSVFVGSKAPLDRGYLWVSGDFTQAGNAFSFVAENSHTVVLDGTADQTITMMNPDNSNPDPSTQAANGSRFANLYLAKDQATDGNVVLATDVAVLIQLRSSGAYDPRIVSASGSKIVAGGAAFTLGTFDNVPIEFVDGDSIDNFRYVTFENMATDTVQIGLRRAESFGSVYNFDNLSFTTAPNTLMGGYYIEAENLGGAPMTLNIWNSYPISGASESNTIGNATLNW